MRKFLLAFIVTASLFSCVGTTAPTSQDTTAQEPVVKQDTIVVEDTTVLGVDSVAVN